MKKNFLVFLALLVLASTNVANAAAPTQSCDATTGVCVTCDENGACVWNDPSFTMLNKRIEKVEGQLKMLNTLFGVASIAGGYTHYAGADAGLGMSQFTLSFRYLRPVGPDCQCQLVNGICQVAKNANPHFIGLEVGSGFGSADKFFQLSPSASFLWYPVAHFGVVVGYQYTRAFDVAGEVDAQAHLSRFGIRIPVVDFGRTGGGLEVEFFGLAGYGEYPNTDTTHQIDPKTGQEFTSRTYSSKTGFAGGGGGSFLLVF